MVFAGFMLAGCVATLPPKVSIDNNYNALGVNTASVTMDCSNVKTDDINPASVPDYCQMLHSSTKASIRKKTGYDIIDDPADMDINIKLEEIYGGNAAARFIVGLGAGRSAITTFVSIAKDGKVIAEGRLGETSTLPNVAGRAWSNDEMIIQDIGILGGKIADFVVNPRDFEANPDGPGYRH
jgi:hypothetical protein